jgi:hypothetical protein
MAQIVEPVLGRPKFKFVDIGLKFFDAKEAHKREKDKVRIRTQRERKAQARKDRVKSQSLDS